MSSRPIFVDGALAGALGRALDLAGVDVSALRDGRVFVGRTRRLDPAFVVVAGDEIVVHEPRAEASRGDVVRWVDRGVVAADKPAGVGTIPDHRGVRGTLVDLVARELGIARERLHATSRLDVGVSGVVLFAMDDAARARLASARERGAYRRHYVAIASGRPAQDEGAWSAAIGRARDPRLRAVGGRDATHAETRFAVIARGAGGVTLLAVEPVTGRTHQIRVHASHAGAPLVGDAAYGGPTRLVSPRGAVRAVGRVALHAAWVEVGRDGAGEARIRAEAPLPADFVAIAEASGLGAGDLERSLAPLGAADAARARTRP